MKVLIVEDDVEQYLYLKNYLEREHGFEVLMQPDGACIVDFEQAMKASIIHKIDFAIIDIELKSNKTGIDFAKYISKSHTPFVILSNYNNEVNLRTLSKLAPVAVLSKSQLLYDKVNLNNAIIALIPKFISLNPIENTISIYARLDPGYNRMDTSDVKESKKNADDFRFRVLNLNSIKCFTTASANKNYSNIVLNHNDKLHRITQLNLSFIERAIGNRFVRVNNKNLVNITEIESYSKSYNQLVLKGEIKLEVTATYQKIVENRLNALFTVIKQDK